MHLFIHFYKNNVLTKEKKKLSSTPSIVLSQPLLLKKTLEQHFRELYRTKATDIKRRH